VGGVGATSISEPWPPEVRIGQAKRTYPLHASVVRCCTHASPSSRLAGSLRTPRSSRRCHRHPHPGLGACPVAAQQWSPPPWAQAVPGACDAPPALGCAGPLWSSGGGSVPREHTIQRNTVQRYTPDGWSGTGASIEANECRAACECTTLHTWDAPSSSSCSCTTVGRSKPTDMPKTSGVPNWFWEPFFTSWLLLPLPAPDATNADWEPATLRLATTWRRGGGRHGKARTKCRGTLLESEATIPMTLQL
jgi:hypothetical protein